MSRVLGGKAEEKYWRCPKDGTYLRRKDFDSKEMVCTKPSCGRVWKVRPSGHIRPVTLSNGWQDVVSAAECRRLVVEGAKCPLGAEVVPLKKETST